MNRYDMDRLRTAACGLWDAILVEIGGIDRLLLDQKHHPCPKCGGVDRFRCLDIDRGVLFCNQCFNKQNGDGFAAIQWLCNLSFVDAVQKVVDWLVARGCRADDFLLSQPIANTSAVSGKKRKSRRVVDDAVFLSEKAAANAVIANMTAASGDVAPPWLSAIYRYSNFSVLRINLPTAPGEKQRKTFRPIYKTLRSDGQEIWKLGYPPLADNEKRPLFLLDELLSDTEPRLVLVVAGEKAALAAKSLGLRATTNAGGEQAVAMTDWTPLIRYNCVAILPDNDPTGRTYALLVRTALRELRPDMNIKIIDLPGLPPKGDIVEWIAGGGTKEQLLALIGPDDIPEAETDSPENDPYIYDRLVCEALQIDVLGELEDGRIKLFSGYYGKTMAIDVARMRYVECLQWFGVPARERIVRAKETDVRGKYTVARVQEAIAILGGLEKAGVGFEKGLGVWLGENNEIVAVGPGRALVWDGNEVSIHRKPRVAGIKVDLDHPREANWFDDMTLKAYIAAAANRQWCMAALDRCAEIFSKWNWKKPESGESVVSELLCGLVLASWVQTIWPWRPLVGIAAASDSGKTTLFETLETMFGPLGLLNAKSSEPGIRQAVGQHAKILLCDEFESDRHRQQILDYFRTASKGSRTLRGVTAGVGGRTYGLQHICWVTAVELGLKRAPDRNRFIILELCPPPAEKRGKLQLPPQYELRDLGQMLLAIAMRYCISAVPIAERLKITEIYGVHGRVIESVATPVAILAAVMQLNDEQQEMLMRAVINGLDTDPVQAVKDETDLLGDILSSHVSLGHGAYASVAQLLAAPNDYIGTWDALARVGIVPVGERGSTSATYKDSDDRREYLFFAHKTVLRYLLKGTLWDGQSIDQILKRIPNAKRAQKVVGGHRPWGVMIPWSLIKTKYLGMEQLEF